MSSTFSWIPKDAKNHFTIEEAIGRSFISLATHPFDVAKTLIQIGYEPLPAYATTNIWGQPRMAYPSVFSYLKYLHKQDGIVGLYRGLGYKLSYSLIHGFIYVNASEFVKSNLKSPSITLGDDDESEGRSVSRSQSDGEEEEDKRSLIHPERLKQLLDSLMKETACKFLAISIAYPFQVMAVRCCAQFVGREKIYNTLSGAISDIYNNSGLSGFYVGFMSKFVGEVIVLWTAHSLIYVTKGILSRSRSNGSLSSSSPLEGYICASINFIVTSWCYPFQLVSTVMICNGAPAASLEASAISLRDPYRDWMECYSDLKRLGQYKRGASMFWRTIPPITRKQTKSFVGSHGL